MHRGMLPLPVVVRRLALVLAAGAVVAAPLAPVAARAEEPAGTTVTGELVQAWPEARHEESQHDAVAEPLTWVETPDGGSVRVRTEELSGVLVGSTVEVTVGDQVPDPADRSGVDPAHDVIGARVVSRPAPVARPAAGALTNEVTVVLVRPAGAPADDVRPGQVAAVVDGPVADFWAEQTGGAIVLGVTGAHDWVTTAAGCDQPTAMWNQAAAAVGFRAGPGRHLLVNVTSAAGQDCAYGLAEVGSEPASGGRVYVRDLLPSLIAHELGHNFGLGHSSALHCGDGPEAGGCTTGAYRDHYDVMGGSWAHVGSLNAVQSAALGVLPPEAVRTLPADGATTDLRLAPVSGGAGVRAVRVVAPDGARYWLELRTAAGRDGWLAGSENRFGLQTGVLVRRAGTWPDTSLLLDPTPTAGPDGDLQTALPAGRPVSLAGGAITVTVGAVGPAGATLRVRSTAATAAPVPAVPATPAPDVLAEEGNVPAPAPPASHAPVAPAAPNAEAPTAPAPGAAEQEELPAHGAGTAAPLPAASPDQVTSEVAPASADRPLLFPAVVGGVLGCAALFVARLLLRGRARG